MQEGSWALETKICKCLAAVPGPVWGSWAQANHGPPCCPPPADHSPISAPSITPLTWLLTPLPTRPVPGSAVRQVSPRFGRALRGASLRGSSPHRNPLLRSPPGLGPPPASLLWLLSLLPSTCLWGRQVLGAPGPAPPHSSPHSPGSVSALSRLHLTSRRLCELQLSPGLFCLEAPLAPHPHQG